MYFVDSLTYGVDVFDFDDMPVDRRRFAADTAVTGPPAQPFLRTAPSAAEPTSCR
jgi:hypothetical protein